MLHNWYTLSARDMTLLYFFQIQLNLDLKASFNGNHVKSVFKDFSLFLALEKHLGELHGTQRTGKRPCGSPVPRATSRMPISHPFLVPALFPQTRWDHRSPWWWLPGPGCVVLSPSGIHMQTHPRMWHIAVSSRHRPLIPGTPPKPSGPLPKPQKSTSLSEPPSVIPNRSCILSSPCFLTSVTSIYFPHKSLSGGQLPSIWKPHVQPQDTKTLQQPTEVRGSRLQMQTFHCFLWNGGRKGILSSLLVQGEHTH